VVEVEQRRLRALEEDGPALRQVAVEDERGVHDPRAVPLPERREVRHDTLPVDVRPAARATQDLLVVPARLRQLVREGGGPEEVPHRDPAPAGLVFVRRPDAPQRRADLPGPPLLLGQGLEAPVVREDEVRAVRDNQVVADLDAERLELASLPLERDRVDHDPVADHAEDPRVEDAGGDEVQHELLSRDDHGVPGVVAAVVARHHLDPRRQQVHDLPLAFVAPLGAGDHDVGHVPWLVGWRAALVYSSAGSGNTGAVDGEGWPSNV
jgi:hypothetical protein